MGVQGFTLVLLAALTCSTALPYSLRQRRQLSEQDILDMFSSSSDNQPKKTTISEKPEIRSIFVESEIENRYAHTKVKSRVINPANETQEVFFSIIIPQRAFITAFSMEIDGKLYKAYIKEKQKAKEQYEEAIKKGQAAAHVQHVHTARDSDKFTTSVNVKPRSKITFILHYEELLARDLGLYNHVITLNPGNIVPELTLQVHIKEPTEIKELFVNNIQSANEIIPDIKENPKAQVEYINPKEVKVRVTVDEEEQKKLQLLANDGAAGQLTLKYNVAPQSPNGDIIVDSNGFFVHFFAPTNETTQKKHVIFVLDTSGSMHGNKIKQLKKAMEVILNELNNDDIFNIIEFSSSVTVQDLNSQAYSAVYHPFGRFVDGNNVNVKPFLATPENKQKAKAVINRMTPDGGTNIGEALKIALKLAKTPANTILGPVHYSLPGPDEPEADSKPEIDAGNTEKFQPIIMFLTDGDPTTGETNFHNIIATTQELNNQEIRIFSLAFGEGASFDFLRDLSARNYGSAKKIYEASDAAIQLNHFYKHISSLILRNVKFIYQPNQLINNRITKREFNNLFQGSETVIAGQIDPKQRKYEIEATTADGIKKYEITIPEATTKPYGPLERLYAYLTISQLLNQVDQSNETEENSPKQTALSLAKRDYWKQVKSFIQLLITWIQFMLGFVQSLLTDAYDYTYVDTAPIARVIETPRETALKLALQYSFVCPLTSLVVVKPDGDTPQEPEKASPTTDTSSQPQLLFSAGGSFARPSFSGYPTKIHFSHGLAQRNLPKNYERMKMKGGPTISRFDMLDGFDVSSIVSYPGLQGPPPLGPTTIAATTFTTRATPTTTTTTTTTTVLPETTTALPETTTLILPETTETSTTTKVLPEITTTTTITTVPPETIATTDPPKITTTEEPEPTTMLVETTTLFAEKHLAEIPWLPARRNGNSLKIYTAEGYKNLILSPPKDLNDTEPCRVFEDVGVCRPLYTCISEIIKESVQDYIEHMCDIPGNYAGVCCLPGVNVTNIVETDEAVTTELIVTTLMSEINTESEPESTVEILDLENTSGKIRETTTGSEE